jgi:hypothetical protein
MATAAVSSSSSTFSQLQTYLQQRRTDAQQLQQDIESGNLTGAQQDFSTIQTLAQSGPFNGNAYAVSGRQQDFADIGQALQAGDITGAQQALTQLEGTFHQSAATSTPSTPAPSAGGGGGPEIIINLGSAPAATSTASTPAPSAGGGGGGPEIILNLANAPAGEQITINLNNAGNGNEQVSLSVANPANQTQNDSQSQNPEQITFSLNQNSNEEILLNLFNSANSASTANSSGNVSLTA